MPEQIPQPRYRLSSYDYPLPEELIAQHPTVEREKSRLLVLDCLNDSIEHSRFDRISDLFRPGDLLVVNNTKVFPARLQGHKETGGRVEMLLLHFPTPCKRQGEASALTMIKSSRRPKPGSTLIFTDTFRARVDSLLPDGKVQVTLFRPPEADFEKLLDQYGQIPLPPYIRRPDGGTAADSKRYQAEYARHTGSVAAPTAGLHFSPSLLEKIEAAGVGRATVTLHVGYGTFAPVRNNDIRAHHIHEEFIYVPKTTAKAVNRVKEKGGRIWAVGTTTARTLEFAADAAGRIIPVRGLCSLYIYPGYQFKVVENLITNFHLPQSSLLFLVSALAERERILNAYHEAVEQKYRFFSYGDAMAIITRK